MNINTFDDESLGDWTKPSVHINIRLQLPLLNGIAQFLFRGISRGTFSFRVLTRHPSRSAPYKVLGYKINIKDFSGNDENEQLKYNYELLNFQMHWLKNVCLSFHFFHENFDLDCWLFTGYYFGTFLPLVYMHIKYFFNKKLGFHYENIFNLKC